MRKEFVVVKNYASAYIRVFNDRLSADDLAQIKKLTAYMKEKKDLFYFLSFPGLSLEKKKRTMEEMLDVMHAPHSLNDLFLLLVHHKRSFLIKDVLEQISVLYGQKNNILFFSITSAHQLSDDQLHALKRFLERKTGKTVVYEYMIDKTLIAGIRCTSDLFVWEYSVRKRLRDIQKISSVQGLA